MKIKDLIPASFLLFPPGVSASRASDELEQAGLLYGLVAKDRHILGFVHTGQLSCAASQIACDGLVQPFHHEIAEDAPVGEVTGKLTGPVLIRKADGAPGGILDSDSLLKSLQVLDRQNLELADEIDSIINFSSDEIYVTDSQGVTLRVNKVFEENSGVTVDRVLGRNVADLEREGLFKPSVAKLVLDQKTKITVLQEYQNGKKVLVTGTPVFEKNGTICRVIINTRDTLKLNVMKADLEEMERQKDRYLQELLHLQEDVNAKHIIAQSKQMKQLLGVARKVAEVDTVVLLLGETGVGKGLIARYIHDNSPRAKNIFVTINCGAIPENLLESELFGYEPGAFTGAGRKGKSGRVELADKGTLFLDEIGDLPPALQVKLLHVIQEGTFTRVGGTKELKLDVHLLAATNKSLKKMVDEGTFREDLYYRLNVIPLEIPPLRQRPEDIGPLAGKFLDKFNQKYRKTKQLSDTALVFLQNYHWPGNVRELENLIERLVIVIGDDVVEPCHLPETIKMTNLKQFEKGKNNLGSQPLEALKGEVEKQILEKLYAQFGNTYKIAGLLKINQSTVVRKLKKYGITKE
jgi:TyrR family helix-turn-helix protein/PAS domain S-box-containing protein